jgi:hypothetical protein
MTRFIVAVGMLVVTTAAVAAPTDYVFDSVSKFDLHTSQPSITGILQGATTPTTVTWPDNTNGDYRYAVSRCVPVFLTMLEKPGRYLLNLRVDPNAGAVGMISCGLELRN